MNSRSNQEKAFALAQANPASSSSLVPMLVGGLVMIVIGMVVALALV